MSLTVGHLRQLLDALDTDLPILLEGCDCVGEAEGVALITEEDEAAGKRCCYIARDGSQSGQHRYFASVQWVRGA